MIIASRSHLSYYHNTILVVTSCQKIKRVIQLFNRVIRTCRVIVVFTALVPRKTQFPLTINLVTTSASRYDALNCVLVVVNNYCFHCFIFLTDWHSVYKRTKIDATFDFFPWFPGHSSLYVHCQSPAGFPVKKVQRNDKYNDLTKSFHQLEKKNRVNSTKISFLTHQIYHILSILKGCMEKTPSGIW